MGKGKGCLRCGKPASGTFCATCSDSTVSSLKDIYWTPDRIEARQEYEAKKKGGKR